MTAVRAVDPYTRGELIGMAAVVAFAFALRLTWGVGADVTPGAASFDDAAWYHKTAIQFMNGNGYLNPFSGQPTAAWPPGYPAVLGAAYRVLGATTATTVLLNAIAGALTCGVLWLLGRTLVGARAGLLAAVLLACFPSHVYFAALALSETLFTFLAMALLALGVRWLARDVGATAWLFWGIGVGIVTLVRSEAITWCILPAAALLSVTTVGRAVRVLVAATLGTMLVLTPWTIRNFRVFGAFVPTNVGLGRTLWAGHNPNATGGMTVEDQRGIEAVMAAAGVSVSGPAGELATNRVLVGEAVAFARAHPLQELKLLPARFYHLFRGDHVWEVWYGPERPKFMPSEPERRRLSRLANAYYLAVGVLALVGWYVRGLPRTAAWRLFDGLIVLCIATFSLTLGEPRYHHVLMPPACVMAAVGLLHLAAGRNSRDVGAPRLA